MDGHELMVMNISIANFECLATGVIEWRCDTHWSFIMVGGSVSCIFRSMECVKDVFIYIQFEKIVIIILGET